TAPWGARANPQLSIKNCLLKFRKLLTGNTVEGSSICHRDATRRAAVVGAPFTHGREGRMPLKITQRPEHEVPKPSRAGKVNEDLVAVKNEMMKLGQGMVLEIEA